MPMLLVDINEQSTAPTIFAQLRDYFGAGNVLPVQLPIGDLAVQLGNGNGLLRVERKDPNDFVASIADGRLVHQVDGMVKSNAWPAVVITGSLSYDTDDMLCINGKSTNWHGTSIRGALRATQWAGCLVDYCAPGHYARTVDELIKFASKPSHAQYHPANRKRKPLIDFYPDETAIQERVEFLMGLPNVGAKLARSLIDWCGARDHTQVGSLAEALSWVTMFPDMDKVGLPEGWSPKKAIPARDFIMGGQPGCLLTQYTDKEQNT